MSRFRRIAGSLAAVLVAYWAYALLAVPWIEPAAPPRTKDNGPPYGGESVEVSQQKLLTRLFPADAWELKNPTILESNRAKLIFQQYRNYPDGRIEIHPCTIVFLYDGPAEDEDQRLRQSIILEAPGGAVLQFDPPLDLSRPRIGRLVGGQLVGQVTIHSDWKEPGPQDDLWIVTRDVQLSQEMIATPHPVDFRWGPHFGRGREMTIKLLSGQPVGAGTAAERWSPAAGPNIAGIESFDLRHVERLHLELPEKGTGPICRDQPSVGARPEGASHKLDLSPFPPGQRGQPGQTGAPVEIRCRGPFHFDVPRRVATFRDGVEVTKLNPSGPADQLTGELLSLYFIGRGAAVPANPDPGSLDLVAQRLEARGNPVVVTAPSRDVNARGPRIEYDLLTESIAMDGEKVPDTFSEVFLQQGPNEIHARSLSYQPAGQGRLGRVTAEGPGWLRGQLAPEKGTGPICAQHPPGRSGKLDLSPFPAGGGQQLQAVWREQLRVFPEGQHHVISLTGGAELQSPGAGQLQAREIFFWLNETPVAGNGEPGRLRPDHMIARYDVRMNSPQLAGEVEQLEVSFENRGDGSEVRGQRPEVRGQGSEFGLQGGGLGGVPPSDPVAGAAPPQRFKVTGRLLQAHVLLGGQQPGISHLLVEDGVRFIEEPSAQLGAQRPLQILGDRLEVSGAAGPGAVVAVTGQPAHCEARGLGLTGTTIHLDRGANRLWIDGPGRMDLPPSGGLPGQAAAAGPLSVDWRRGMSFDGQTATFEDTVTAATPGQTPQQQLRTQTMTVRLQRPVSFSEQRGQEPPQIAEIACHGGVRMENRTLDPQGRWLAYDQLEVPDLSVNAQTGETKADGAGWLHSVRRGTAGGGLPAGQANPAAPASTADQFVCLHVKFQKSISGTLPVPRPAGGAAPLLRLTFADQVQVAYAPVDRWDVEIPLDDPDKLGPQGMTAHCDQLTVAETLSPAAAARTGEVSATGNAVVEGTTLAPRGKFTARGNRISYDGGKGMLVLEGDGRRDAELLWQSQPGVEPQFHTAQKMIYWPKIHQWKVERAQSLGIGQMPGRTGTR